MRTVFSTKSMTAQSLHVKNSEDAVCAFVLLMNNFAGLKNSPIAVQQAHGIQQAQA
jgi:hypothetical protein